MVDMILEAQDITVKFGGLVAIDNVSMAVKRGQIHGLIGPNGAGKTTFFNVSAGLIRQSAGKVLFKGNDISSSPAHERAAMGLRRSFQSVQLVPNLTAAENILIGLHSDLMPKTPATVLRLLFGQSPDLAALDKVREISEFLGIAHTLDKQASELTFADQRFIEIARAIISNPAILMLDEPAAGLSEAEIQHLDALLRKLVEKKSMSVLLVEHVLSLVMGISDEITVLENGRLIACGTPEEIAANSKVKAAYLGEDSNA